MTYKATFQKSEIHLFKKDTPYLSKRQEIFEKLLKNAICQGEGQNCP